MKKEKKQSEDRKEKKKDKNDLNYYKSLAEENLRGWQRAQADYKNLIKRSESERSGTVAFANEQLILEILPILDNFKHAVDHLPEKLADEDWVRGIVFIKNQMEQIISDQDVKEVPAAKQKFDPEKHDAIESIKSDKVKRGYVVEVVQAGYEMKGKVIRAAKVKVAK